MRSPSSRCAAKLPRFSARHIRHYNTHAHDDTNDEERSRAIIKFPSARQRRLSIYFTRRATFAKNARTNTCALIFACADESRRLDAIITFAPRHSLMPPLCSSSTGQRAMENDDGLLLLGPIAFSVPWASSPPCYCQSPHGIYFNTLTAAHYAVRHHDYSAAHFIIHFAISPVRRDKITRKL